MSREWQYVLHQRVVEFMDGIRPADRRRLRDAIFDLVRHPWQDPASEIRPANDRAYYVKDLDGFRIVYWLDAYVKEVCIVRVDRI
jgi:hypothetical protein